METIKTKKIAVNKETFDNIVAEKAQPYIKKYNSIFWDILHFIESKCTETFKNSGNIELRNNFVLDYWLKILVPVDYKLGEPIEFQSENVMYKHYYTDELFQDELRYEIPTLTAVKKHVSLLKKYGDVSLLCIYNDKNNYGKLCSYNLQKNTIAFSGTAYSFPIITMQFDDDVDLIVKYIAGQSLIPKNMNDELIYFIEDLRLFMEHDSHILGDLNENIDTVFYGGHYLLNKYKTDSEEKWMHLLHWELVQILHQYYKDKNIPEVIMDTRDELLNCEKIRADIDPYDEKILTDPNRGHWDLWRNCDSDEYTIEVADNMYARNPISDINTDGVIAIDFGTKSTIVVYQSDFEYSLPMGIGDGKLGKAPSSKRYENPTVMHFVDLESFLKAYNSKPGRPKTKWEDLTISHTAIDQFNNSISDGYYEYLHQIKQWAGHREKKFRIQDHNGKSYELPAFIDLREGQLNPIEIYAYYIGLYINNMRKGHGIFLDYYLSFPVTYETRIREKIITSFENGLKKSLPTSILENSEIMKCFHVNGNISEPAAYAVCALQEYAFDPEEDEEVFYGIFDFGGGTTDFDFGIWKKSSKRRYDYSIENFGAGGDEYLGGENLLEMIAFEVFKSNQSLMRENGFTFTLAPKCKEFPGSDALLAESQESEKNMSNLMEVIRPFWESPSDISDISVKKAHADDVDHLISAIKKICADSIVNDPSESMLSIQSEIFLIEKGWKHNCQTAQINIDNTIDGLCKMIKKYGLDIEEPSYDNNGGKCNDNFDSSVEDEIELKLTLFDKNGKDHPGVKLKYRKSLINEIIENAINEGINNFFAALLLSYQNERVKKPTKINILLAGNSCKSPVVTQLFKKKIEEYELRIHDKYGSNLDKNEKLFEIYPPLGTEDASLKQLERGIMPMINDYIKPTGKTGVAYGLIQCRAGGTIEVINKLDINDEIPFQYFIGWKSKGKFEIFKDDSKTLNYIGKPNYNEWHRFIDASVPVFDLYYTSLPECVEGQLIVDGNSSVKRLRCEINGVYENANVYIRAINPHTLEYTVASTDDVEKTMLDDIVRKEL